MIRDIRCPSCGAVDAVEKVAIGRYRCTECDHEFTREDVVEEQV